MKQPLFLDRHSPEIIANQKTFIEQWRIKSRSKATIHRPNTEGTGYYYDHPRLFRDMEGNLVLVVSLYGDVLPPPRLKMVKVAKLYHPNAVTFAGKYKKLKGLRRLLEKSDCRYKNGTP